VRQLHVAGLIFTVGIWLWSIKARRQVLLRSLIAKSVSPGKMPRIRLENASCRLQDWAARPAPIRTPKPSHECRDFARLHTRLVKSVTVILPPPGEDFPEARDQGVAPHTTRLPASLLSPPRQRNSFADPEPNRRVMLATMLQAREAVGPAEPPRQAPRASSRGTSKNPPD
jgi:hypothetical protein